MAKYKVTFTKHRKGQTSFERSLSLESLELLFALCESISIQKTKKKTGKIFFIFPDGDLFRKVITVQNVPLWILKKFLPEKEWEKPEILPGASS